MTKILALFPLLAAAVLIASPAAASTGAATVQACYASAEAAHPGLQVGVKIAGTPVVNTTDLDGFFDTVAEVHESSAMTLHYNVAGRSAIRRALSCIFDAEYMTLSSIVVNETGAPLQVRAHTIKQVESTGTTYMSFDDVDRSGCSVGPVLFFAATSSSAGCHSSAYSTDPLASFDLVASTMDIDVQISLCAKDLCNGSCLGECNNENYFVKCVCYTEGGGQNGHFANGCRDLSGSFTSGSSSDSIITLFE